MIVPVRVCWAAVMPMNMDVPTQRRGVCVQGRIQRIAHSLRRIIVFVVRVLLAVIVTIIVLNETRLVAVLVAVVLKGNINIKAVRFRYLIDRLPEGPVILTLE